MPSVGSADRRFIGSILLVVVNILWVLSTELTSFIFIDEDFRRPFFTVYVKTCMLCIYFVRYLFSSPSESEHKYKILNEESDLEMDEVNVNALEPEGFETVSTISESDNEGDPVRRIRFSERREVRRLPSSEAIDAQRARLPYREVLACSDYFTCSPRLKYAVFFFAPMWLACSFTYQAALLFTSVSSLNLISCSSSLFVLILSTCLPSKKAKFTLVKAILVLLNLAGVLIVSQFSTKLTGAVLAQISAIAYAIYLVMYARFMDRYGEIDMNLMFGSVGLLGVIVGTPLIFVLDVTGYEKLYPLPDSYQLSSIVLSAVFGTLLADYLWLMAAGMTDSVSASLSLTLSIPLSFLADSLFRSSPPSMLQLFAAVPITLSFIGAALVEQNSSQTRVTVTGDQDQESLLTNDEDEPAIAPAASMVPTTSKLSSSTTPPSLLLPGAFSPPTMLFGIPSPASSLENSSSPLQNIGTTSAFRPIVPTGDAFFLSAIHTLVLSTPGEDALSESNCSSDKSGCEESPSATNILCQVCSDKASGFHYGVFACEGCKGFFRRSIQQKIQYRPCSRSQDCLIVRNNRNRCQYCRLKKCISVGMSRDAVRFGRVPKREKAKMVEDMQRTTVQSQMDAVAVQFENDNEASERIQQAFNQLVNALDTCSQTVPGRCPLQFHSYLLGLKAVIDFANAIPGFLCLPQTERIILLKATCFDSLLVAWSTSQQPSVWMTSSLIFSQSLLQFSRRVRLLPPSCAAILCALAVVQPLPSQPLALRLAERLWLLMAKIGGTATISAAPSLLTEARALRICHNEFFRLPKPMTPLSISVPQDNLTAPMSTPRSSYRERHPSIASLLEKPVNLNLLSPASSKSGGGGEHISCDSEDEPLNLCVRESNPMTKVLN